jgi:hypothetical protein
MDRPEETPVNEFGHTGEAEDSEDTLISLGMHLETLREKHRQLQEAAASGNSEWQQRATAGDAG